MRTLIIDNYHSFTNNLVRKVITRRLTTPVAFDHRDEATHLLARRPAEPRPWPVRWRRAGSARDTTGSVTGGAITVAAGPVRTAAG